MSEPAITTVLMSADAVGGVWTYAMGVARALSSRGVRVALATMGPRPSPAQRRAAADIPGLSVHESDHALEWMDDPWLEVARAGDWLLALERSIRPDVVHLNGYAHGDLPLRAPHLVVAHSCVLSWWSAVHREEAPPRYRHYRERVRSGLLGARAVIAPTEAMAASLARSYGVGGVRVVPNGLDGAGFGPSAKEPIVLATGRVWDKAKNIALLEAVAPALEWPVIVLGACDEPGTRGPRARFDHVRTLGEQDRTSVASWMGRAAIFAHPAWYEPFGLAPLEAALSGCALVLSDIPGLREIWGDAASYADPDDARAWTATLRALMRDHGARVELAARARRRAREWTLERSVRGLFEIYGTIVGRRMDQPWSASCA
jgi:glycosyltransferase involved in cell wall biosynthesis